MNDWARTLFDASRAAIEGGAKQRGEPASSPVARYLDPSRHVREQAALRRLPLAAAPSAWLREPGDWVTRSVHGVPVLLLRGADGALRAFLNVCRHRGAELLPAEQRGSARARIVCPYHSWTYAPDGCLLGRPHGEEFPHAPRESSGLVALPVAERLGLVWVVAERDTQLDWDTWFGPLGAELTGHGFDADAVCTHRRGFGQPSNWKLPLDGNLETYHFQYGHRETIAPLFHDNLVLHYAFGDHQRLVLPKRSLREVDPATPVDAQLLGRHCNVIYFFFPASLLLWQGDHLQALTLSPRAPDASHVESWLLAPPAVHAKRRDAYWQENFEIFWRAIDEDFAFAASIQRGLAGGANASLAFGTSEFPAELFERAVERLIG
jgi:phenylpropionate dioxygenase-like ring-hydroxylating dioxygenase large terminal subunit